MGAMTRDEQRRLEILEMFEVVGASIFDRGGRGKPTAIGYSHTRFSWLAPKPREPRERPAKPPKHPRESRAMPREERLRRRAARERARYHAMSPAEKKARNGRNYTAIKADARRLDKHRERGREHARCARAAGRSQYQRMTPSERKAFNAAVYAQKKADAAKLDKKRAENREWMRKKRAQKRKTTTPTIARSARP